MHAVIIPARNAARTLPATLASLHAQTAPWEGILVDDGSTDETASIARAAGLRVILGPRRGVAAARNVGVAASAAPRLAFLDADDLWAPDRLQRDAASGADASFGRVSFFDTDPARPTALSAHPAKRLSMADVVAENPTCTMSNIAVSRAAFMQAGGFDETMTHGEDLEWLIRLTGSGAHVAGLPQPLCFYRRSEAGLSSDLAAMRAGHVRAMATARRLGLDPGPAAEAVHLRYLARRALRLRRPEARALALEGLRLAPRAFLSPARRGLPTLALALLHRSRP
ncbi:glycosyltransferase family 2 protein [Jannaschia sp.]|nr:glycosyltransferase family 2 protein [Jannaschia sp.]